MIGIRALQHALRRYRETTPTALLQQVRLERAHIQLVVSDSRTASVSMIARQWGFVHLGRFAGNYRTRYGETPGETLRCATRSRGRT